MFELLEKISAALEEKGIAYMLSGSLAMNSYAVPRMTRDIDIVINLQESDIEKFTEIFQEGFYMHKESIREAVRKRGMFNIIDFNGGQKIDFIIRKNAKFNINKFNRRILTGTHGFDVWIVSIEDLIIAKLGWIQQIQSDMQMGDIRSLLENSIVDLDT